MQLSQQPNSLSQSERNKGPLASWRARGEGVGHGQCPVQARTPWSKDFCIPGVLQWVTSLPESKVRADTHSKVGSKLQILNIGTCIQLRARLSGGWMENWPGDQRTYSIYSSHAPRSLDKSPQYPLGSQILWPSGSLFP